MALKTFDASLVQVLNGVDTYSFKVLSTSSEVATTIVENRPISVRANGMLAFGGSIKEISSQKNGLIKTVLAETPFAKVRDTTVSEEYARGMTKTSTLMREICTEGVRINYLASVDPPIKYAFRNGTIISHINTLCSLSGLNWRNETVSATSCIITISNSGDIASDVPVFVENKDIFNLTLDTSLFKKYTKVTVIGVEKEVAGHTCTASLQSATHLILDCDDGEVGNEEVLPPGVTYSYLSPANTYKRVLLDYGAQLKGWDGTGYALIGSEVIKYSSKSGNTLLGVEREVWSTCAADTYVRGDPVVHADYLYVKFPPGVTAFVDPATTLFKIGAEIIKAETVDSSRIKLATISAADGYQEGRGLEFNSDMRRWITNPLNIYSHKHGTPIVPIYPHLDYTEPASTLAVTIHGQGIVTKDGIDKLAYGVLTNIQNGILSGKFTYSAGDFSDISIGVGQKCIIKTATVKTGRSNIISPATEYEVLIYSMTRRQNKLMEVEFGNVTPETIAMLKSGEYALQAAVKKHEKFKETDLSYVSVSGKTGVYGPGNTQIKLVW